MNAFTRLDRIENLFPEMMRRWARPMSVFDDERMPADIRLDVSENDKEYVVSAEIPGARKDDIRVSIDGNYVSITAEIKKDEEEKHGRTLLKETYRGSMSRGFTLGSEVDQANVVAKLEDGVLRLTLPKRQGTSSHVVPIQ
ncbi:MAG: Hsp20 family protein [Gammaproteobacteria bacterium]|nr:Hsp20 family protein [Gammaproteobacteria bacterium]MBU1442128.1 Hsp20 family protein [Gammaproteobacteria bacterium]